jgi:hypothetical protein
MVRRTLEVESLVGARVKYGVRLTGWKDCVLRSEKNKNSANNISVATKWVHSHV